MPSLRGGRGPEARQGMNLFGNRAVTAFAVICLLTKVPFHDIILLKRDSPLLSVNKKVRRFASVKCKLKKFGKSPPLRANQKIDGL